MLALSEGPPILTRKGYQNRKWRSPLCHFRIEARRSPCVWSWWKDQLTPCWSFLFFWNPQSPHFVGILAFSWCTQRRCTAYQ